VAVRFGDGYAVGIKEIMFKKEWIWEVRRGKSFRLRNASNRGTATIVFLKMSNPRTP
jgi:hypothetical protein